MPYTAYIGLGSNLGDRRALLGEAVARLRAHPGIRAVSASRWHETEPVGGPSGQPPYLNGAARVETELSAPELLAVLLGVEADLGRVRLERWGPRTVDLDLLLFEDWVVDTPALIVPHPRMHERGFVLEPLAELAPAVRHPVLGLTVAELLQRLQSPPAKP